MSRSEPTLIERLNRLEQRQLDARDRYGAKVIHRAVKAWKADQLANQILVKDAERVKQAESVIADVKKIPDSSCAGYESRYKHGWVDGMNEQLHKIKAIIKGSNENET